MRFVTYETKTPSPITKTGTRKSGRMKGSILFKKSILHILYDRAWQVPFGIVSI
ncbi:MULTISPECIES: hypothetical protein [Bacillus cereus group]|uniref:hypothetical protein n=1 Tax=Bacillus cereus group TaxID=86661 RepID=UPI001680CA7D|nr:hypothetical protein [Bacillus cereus]MCU4986445.1 hypothetical protein [Bacillus cereus]